MARIPFHASKAVEGLRPMPGTVSYDHPATQITPNKVKVSMVGKRKGSK